MAVKRYVSEFDLQFIVSDDLTITRRVQYEGYSTSPEAAEQSTRMFVQDMSKKLCENTADFVREQFYNHRVTPSITSSIKVVETHKPHDFDDGDTSVSGLIYSED